MHCIRRVDSKLDALEKTRGQTLYNLQDIASEDMYTSDDDDDEIETMLHHQERDGMSTGESYKDPLTPRKIERMKELEAEYAGDVTLVGLQKLFERTRSMTYQFLTHLDADRRNREFIEAMPEDEGKDAKKEKDGNKDEFEVSDDESDEKEEALKRIKSQFGDFVDCDALEQDKS